MKVEDILLIVLIIVLLALIFYYFMNQQRYPIPNDGSIENISNPNSNNNIRSILKNNNKSQSSIDSPIYFSDKFSEFSPNVSTNFSDDDKYNSNEDEETFMYKKRKYVKKNQADIEDMYNPENLLPQEINDDYFDLSALQDAKTIKGAHLIHPKTHIGINTVNSTHKNMIRDIRGEVHTPKTTVSPWMMSTIDPDMYSRPLC